MNNLTVSGSATGNPRNKNALAPGKSLMDWVRLCSSGKDLCGTGGVLMNVTFEELASHSKSDDAWLALRGTVYNVTEYMSFHPGGEKELMRGVGKDATKLFEKIHPWVNYESMLKRCLIGRLADATFPSPSSVFSSSPEKLVNDRVSSLNANLSSVNISHGDLPIAGDDVLKCHWFQQNASLTLRFSLKLQNVSNPLPVSVLLNNKKHMVIRIDKEILVYNLEEDIRWPCAVKIHQHTAEIKLTKEVSKLWSTLGNRQIGSNEMIPEYCRMKVIHVSVVTHNTKLIGFQYETKRIHYVHVGHHVKFKCDIDGKEVIRSYTPVSFLTQSPTAFPEPTLFFLVKKYEHGKLSHKLCLLQTNDFIEMSTPRGTFNSYVFRKQTTLLLLAAGTGLTPMTSLIIWALNLTRLNVRLIYFNKTENDIIWKEEISRLTTSNPRFQVRHILSQPSESWSGEKGLISEELFKELFKISIQDFYTCVCGPAQFNNLCIKYIKESGCSDDDYHAFGE